MRIYNTTSTTTNKKIENNSFVRSDSKLQNNPFLKRDPSVKKISRDPSVKKLSRNYNSKPTSAEEAHDNLEKQRVREFLFENKAQVEVLHSVEEDNLASAIYGKIKRSSKRLTKRVSKELSKRFSSSRSSKNSDEISDTASAVSGYDFDSLIDNNDTTTPVAPVVSKKPKSKKSPPKKNEIHPYVYDFSAMNKKSDDTGTKSSQKSGYNRL